MKKRTQRIIVIILAVVMLLSVLLPAISMISGAAVTKDDINKLKDQISANSAQIKEVEKKLKEVQGNKNDALQQKKLLDQKIALLNAQISDTEAVIEEYAGLIEEKESEIATLEAKETAQYDLFCRQVRDMEETGSVSYLSILFSASSFTELLDYSMMISEVMEYNNGVIDALKATQEALKTTKEELESDKAEQESLKAEQEASKSDLLTQEAKVDKLIKEIKELEADYQAELDKYESASKKLDAQLAAAEKKYKEQLAALEAKNNAGSGEWYWPLPGRYYISSTFAYRKHPITGKWSHHTGNDIPAPGGTEIHAAKDGVVTDVGKNSVYGNYIQISHGNGYSTFYAHMKSTAIVKEGATVKRGQVIGYVGTTGYSTGNHLHFELRVNGTRADALKLYPNLKFTYSY